MMSPMDVQTPSHIHRINGYTPNIYDEALIITDHAKSAIYTFGGCRWRFDTNLFNSQPTSDFCKFDLINLKWTNLTHLTKFEALVEFPFAVHLPPDSRPNSKVTTHSPSKLQPTLKPITAALNPMGQIIHIEETDSSYFLIFGGQRIGIDGKLTCSNDMICVDLQTYLWRRIVLDGSRGVPGLVGGTMICINNKLYVFGGFQQKLHSSEGFNVDKKQLTEPSEVYSVIDMVKRKWVVQAMRMPDEIGALGLEPQGIPVEHGKKIVLLRGRDSDVLSSFHSIFIYDIAMDDWEMLGTQDQRVPLPDDNYQFEPFSGLDNNLSTSDYAGILFVWSCPDEGDEESDDESMVTDSNHDQNIMDSDGNLYSSVEERSVAVRLLPTKNISIWLFEYRDSTQLTESELKFKLVAGRPWWVQLYKSIEVFGPDSNFRIGYCVNTTSQNIVLLGYCPELVPAHGIGKLARRFNAYLVADGNPLELERDDEQEESFSFEPIPVCVKADELEEANAAGTETLYDSDTSFTTVPESNDEEQRDDWEV